MAPLWASRGQALSAGQGTAGARLPTLLSLLTRLALSLPCFVFQHHRQPRASRSLPWLYSLSLSLRVSVTRAAL